MGHVRRMHKENMAGPGCGEDAKPTTVFNTFIAIMGTVVSMEFFKAQFVEVGVLGYNILPDFAASSDPKCSGTSTYRLWSRTMQRWRRE